MARPCMIPKKIRSVLGFMGPGPAGIVPDVEDLASSYTAESATPTVNEDAA